jgi:hypothetical protein
MLTYYIDESGHSGDLASNTGKAFDFEGQPYFLLAAVGVSDEAALEILVSDLRKKHKLPPGELKSKSIQAKPAFVADLLNFLLDEKCPLFVEVVDKRYFICIQIVNCNLLPPALGYDSGAAVWKMRNLMVDWLYDCVSQHVLDQFVDACRTPSDHSLVSALGSQILLATGEAQKEGSSSFGPAMQGMVEDTLLAYGKMRATDPNAFSRFLPVPDNSKSGRKIWMLPNLSSLTNLYARINRFHQRRLAGISLVHDQQLQLDRILEMAKAATETTTDKAFTPHSDHRFTQSAGLEFSASDRNLGVQCADVLAGTVMRYFRDNVKGVAVNPHIEFVVRRLLSDTDSETSYGINQVVPTRMVMNGLL